MGEEMIQRLVVASILSVFLMLPFGCNQKEKAILPSSMIPLPPHGPVAGGTGRGAGKDTAKPSEPAKDSKTAPAAPSKDKATDPVKKDAPK